MEAPICRLCNTRHWPKEPHKWGVAVNIEHEKVLTVTPKQLTVTEPKLTVTAVPRADYMKAYMRAYRKSRAWPKRDRAEYMRAYRLRVKQQ